MYLPSLDVLPFVREAVYSRDWVLHRLIADWTEVFYGNLERWAVEIIRFSLRDSWHKAWSPGLYFRQLPSILSPIDQESSQGFTIFRHPEYTVLDRGKVAFLDR
jgi:hypothetical protein